jgi:hypothetical protein
MPAGPARVLLNELDLETQASAEKPGNVDVPAELFRKMLGATREALYGIADEYARPERLN